MENASKDHSLKLRGQALASTERSAVFMPREAGGPQLTLQHLLTLESTGQTDGIPVYPAEANMAVGTGEVHVHICTGAYGGLRLMTGIMLSCSCTVLIEAECLCQIPSSSQAVCSGDALSLPSGAGIMGRLPCLSGVYWDLGSRLQASHLQVSPLTAKPSLQPSSF